MLTGTFAKLRFTLIFLLSCVLLWSGGPCLSSYLSHFGVHGHPEMQKRETCCVLIGNQWNTLPVFRKDPFRVKSLWPSTGYMLCGWSLSVLAPFRMRKMWIILTGGRTWLFTNRLILWGVVHKFCTISETSEFRQSTKNWLKFLSRRKCIGCEK